MSLICSLAGHDWGETQKETEYDEGSDEIAVTEREFRVCDRCDERRIVAENTEVRAKTGTGEERLEDEQEGVEGSGPSETPHPADRGSTAGESSEETGATATEAAATSDAPDEGRDAAIIDEGETGGGGGGTSIAEPEDADYTCPDCDFASSDPSLREGDICPECGTGYIEEV